MGREACQQSSIQIRKSTPKGTAWGSGFLGQVGNVYAHGLEPLWTASYYMKNQLCLALNSTGPATKSPTLELHGAGRLYAGDQPP